MNEANSPSKYGDTEETTDAPGKAWRLKVPFETVKVMSELCMEDTSENEIIDAANMLEDEYDVEEVVVIADNPDDL